MTALRVPASAHEQALLRLADRSADAVDAEVRAAWGDVLAAVEAGGPWWVVHRRVATALRRLHFLPGVLADDLRKSGTAAHQFIAGKVARSAALRSVVEDELLDPVAILAPSGPTTTLADLLLPNPTREEVDSVVFSGGWLGRLTSFTRLAEPESLAAVVANGLATGRTGAQVIRDVLPVVEHVRTVARRVARDAGLWVAHEIELRAYERLGPEVVTGYTVHAVPRTRYSRPEHLRRSGTSYYRVPKGDQFGFDRMPRPPFEADGTLAYGCRCYLTPIIDEG